MMKWGTEPIPHSGRPGPARYYWMRLNGGEPFIAKVSDAPEGKHRWDNGHDGSGDFTGMEWAGPIEAPSDVAIEKIERVSVPKRSKRLMAQLGRALDQRGTWRNKKPPAAE